MKEYEEALKWFEKAVALFPDSALLYIYGGDAAERLGRIEEAFSHWDRAIELEAAWLDARYSKAFCYKRLGRIDDAYRSFLEIAQILEGQGYGTDANYPYDLAMELIQKAEVRPPDQNAEI